MEPQIQLEHLKQHGILDNLKGCTPLGCKVSRARRVKRSGVTHSSRSFHKCCRRVSELSMVIWPMMGPEAERAAGHNGVAKGNQIST